MLHWIRFLLDPHRIYDIEDVTSCLFNIPLDEQTAMRIGRSFCLFTIERNEKQRLQIHHFNI